MLDPDIDSHGESFVGGCQGAHVKGFTIAGPAAVKFLTIRAGDPFLLETFMAGEGLIAFPVNRIWFLSGL
jgi:hypothetical protein